MFVWDVENYGAEAIEVSITFTFKNGQGDSSDLAGGVWNEPFQHGDKDTSRVHGVMIHQQFNHMPCTYAVAAKVEVSPLIVAKSYNKNQFANFYY